MKRLTSYLLLGQTDSTVLSWKNLAYALDPHTGAVDISRLTAADQEHIQIIADPYFANAVVMYLRGSESQKQKIRNFCTVRNRTICIDMNGYVPVADYLADKDELTKAYVKAQLQLQMAFGSVEANPQNWITEALAV